MNMDQIKNIEKNKIKSKSRKNVVEKKLLESAWNPFRCSIAIFALCALS